MPAVGLKVRARTCATVGALGHDCTVTAAAVPFTKRTESKNSNPGRSREEERRPVPHQTSGRDISLHPAQLFFARSSAAPKESTPRPAKAIKRKKFSKEGREKSVFPLANRP